LPTCCLKISAAFSAFDAMVTTCLRSKILLTVCLAF
jgi:hypothetical protein